MRGIFTARIRRASRWKRRCSGSAVRGKSNWRRTNWPSLKALSVSRYRRGGMTKTREIRINDECPNAPVVELVIRIWSLVRISGFGFGNFYCSFSKERLPFRVVLAQPIVDIQRFKQKFSRAGQDR